MLLARLALIAVAVAVVGVVNAHPARLIYNHVAGERVTVHVTDCDRERRRLDCRGTWRDSAGRTHEGRVHGAHSHEVGRRVSAQAGPVGVYVGGLARQWVWLAVPVITVLALLGTAVAVVWLGLRTRAHGRELLARPGALLAEPRRIRRAADGRTLVSLRPAAAPPRHDPTPLPGGKPREKTSPVLDRVLRLAANPARRERFIAARDPSGAVRFIIERRPTGADQPETWLLAPDGEARGVVRRLEGTPFRAQFLRADGERVGSVKPDPQVPETINRFIVRDRSGRRVATVGPGTFLRWACHIEPDADPLVRDLTLVLTVDLIRLVQA